MTTDTVPKIVTRKLTSGGQTWTVTGICKGAAMIAPNMATMLSVIMITIALSIVLRALIEMVFGSAGRPLSTPLPSGVFQWGELRISQLHLTGMLVCWACMAGFGAFFRFTKVGLLMRATADSHEAAVASGINVHSMNRLAWSIGSLLAAIGGLFMGQLQIVSTELESIGLLALPAVVIGGLQSIPGAIVGGLLVGLIEQLVASYVSPKASDIFIYGLLLLILSWNEAFWSINLSSSHAAPLTVFIASYSSPEGLFWAKLSAASLLAVAPIMVLGWLTQKQLVRGLTFGAVK